MKESKEKTDWDYRSKKRREREWEEIMDKYGMNELTIEKKLKQGKMEALGRRKLNPQLPWTRRYRARHLRRIAAGLSEESESEYSDDVW